ncbi:MAG: hypothetical protein SOW22_02310 [Candidatus Egerieousia sp.]|nr:hypothetical protein [Candidatus Egerieousia sp.]
MFFSDDSPQWRCQQRLPDGSPHWHFRPQLLPDAAASSLVEHLPPSGNIFRRSAPASSICATATPLASSIFPMALRSSAPASNKPHPAEEYSGLASNLAHLGRIC